MKISDARKADKKHALIALAVFIGLIALSLVIKTSLGVGKDQRIVSNERAFPGLGVTPKQIHITTNETDYTLSFDGDHWIVPGKAGFPVDMVKMVQLLNALQTARFTDARTSLESRHDDLGLGNPTLGGNGAMIEIPGTNIRPVIIGRRNQIDYGRRSNENKSWVLDTAFPALHSPDWWLDLSLIGLPGEKPVSKVEIRQPPKAAAYVIRPGAGEVSGGDRFLVQASADLKLEDVAPYVPETMQVYATHKVYFTDQSDLEIGLILLDGKIWARLSGTALKRPDLADARIFKLDPLSASELLP